MDSADRIYRELLHEAAAIWYIADDFGMKIMVKIPSTAIKSLIAGCKMDFLYGKDTQHIFPFVHAGIRIYDDPVHYLRVTCIQRFTQEHKALKKIMKMESVNIHFHNELAVCIATATLVITKADRDRATALLGNTEDLYTGSFNHLATHSLNCFDYSVGKDKATPDVSEIIVLFINGTLSKWVVMNNIFAGVHEINPISIDNNDEGDIFEKQVWVTLESMFSNSLYRNPRIADKQGFRELTDVLAFHLYGAFLLETKALSLLDTGKDRSMDRKVTGLKKQISKGIDQMKGAARKVASGVEVFDNKGNPVHFDRAIKPHCIVLVSELLPFGDWKEIEHKMLITMTEQPMFLNVMDLREFMSYVSFCQGNKEKLDVALMDRVTQFTQLKDIHMRAVRETKQE